MGPGAYSLLDSYDLPRPRILAENELSDLGPSAAVYVRGSHDIQALNKRILATDAIRLIHDNPDVASNIKTIELSPNVSFGGAALITEALELYIEAAIGHTSGLLHYGFCAGRLFRGKNQRSFRYAAIKQPRCVIQGIPSDQISPTNSGQAAKVEAIAKSAASYLTAAIPKLKQETPTLFEWIYDEELSVQFVDCKVGQAALLSISFDNIFGQKPALVENTVVRISDLRICYFGDYSKDFRSNLPSEPFYVRITNQAILSHFLTYTATVQKMVEMV